MLLPLFAFILVLRYPLVAVLSFDPDFNGTIPSILGITNFSYPSSSSLHHRGTTYADGTLNSARHQPWPFTILPNRETYLIRYCYADAASKTALLCSFSRAVQLWKDALGGLPSVETGYNVHFLPAFIRTGDNFGEELCYQAGTYDSKTGQGTWNWKLHNRQDMLVLAHRPVDEEGNKPATAASLGYTPEGALMPWEGRQARHWLQVSEAEDEVKIAHEIGHVLGLVHEHQRTDRDDHILYRPENVQGYAEALRAAVGDGVPEEEAREKLRDDHAFCMKYGFRGEAYVKGAGQQGVIQGDPSQGSQDFDFDSIMIYPSDALTDTAACRADTSKCPIVRRAGKDSLGNEKFEFISAPSKPSAKDAEFVRALYPWQW